MTSAYVYASARTPFGKLGGALAEVRPDDLAATALSGLLAKTPGLEPDLIGEVVWGNANGAGEENRNVGRMALLLAGLPVSVPATTVNRLCGSSLDAAMIGSRTIETGDAEIVRGRRGRVDDPGALGAAQAGPRLPGRRPRPPCPPRSGWRLVNRRMPAEWTVSLGEGNEQLQEKYAISRERQDAFAARSHRSPTAAWDEGFYDDLVVAVPGRRARPGTRRSGPAARRRSWPR